MQALRYVVDGRDISIRSVPCSFGVTWAMGKKSAFFLSKPRHYFAMAFIRYCGVVQYSLHSLSPCVSLKAIRIYTQTVGLHLLLFGL